MKIPKAVKPPGTTVMLREPKLSLFQSQEGLIYGYRIVAFVCRNGHVTRTSKLRPSPLAPTCPICGTIMSPYETPTETTRG